MYIERSKLKANSDLRAQARMQLKGNWGISILVCFLFSLIVGIPACVPYVGFIGTLILTGPFMLGLCMFFIKLARDNKPPISNLFDGFNRFGDSLGLYLLVFIFVLLWSLLLVIPGIIAALRYSMAFYILSDNPDMGASEALNRSKELMNGQKGKLFLLGLSFIGWALLCALTFGIGYLWLAPYMQAATANFYEDVKNAHNNLSAAPANSAI